MKNITIALFFLLSVTSAFANGNKEEKHKEDMNLKINIHTDKKGNVHIDGDIKGIKEIEDLVNDCLKNVSIEMKEGKDKKGKKLNISVNIKEK